MAKFLVPDQSAVPGWLDPLSPMVYFLSADHLDHPIKIGSSTRHKVRARFAQIQTGVPYRLVPLLVCEGGRGIEKSAHETFREHRLHGEWFAPVASILELISEMTTEFPNWRERFW